MLAITALVHDDPYLKMPIGDRIAARALRRARFWDGPLRPASVSAPHPLPAPVRAPKAVDHRMWFEDLVKVADREVARPVRYSKVSFVQQVCARHFDVTQDDLLSPCRTKGIVRARQVAMYLCRIHTDRSFPEIGRRFGNRDHTTGIHAFDKIKRLVATDVELASSVDALSAIIKARF